MSKKLRDGTLIINEQYDFVKSYLDKNPKQNMLSKYKASSILDLTLEEFDELLWGIADEIQIDKLLNKPPQYDNYYGDFY